MNIINNINIINIYKIIYLYLYINYFTIIKVKFDLYYKIIKILSIYQ